MSEPIKGVDGSISEQNVKNYALACKITNTATYASYERMLTVLGKCRTTFVVFCIKQLYEKLT